MSLYTFAVPPTCFWFVNRTSPKGLTGQLPKEWKEGCRVKFQQTNRWKAWQGGPSGPYSKVPDQQLLWDCPSKRVRSGSASKTLYLWNSPHYKQSFHIQNQRIIHKLRNSAGERNPGTKYVCLFQTMQWNDNSREPSNLEASLLRMVMTHRAHLTFSAFLTIVLCIVSKTSVRAVGQAQYFIV